MTKPTTPADNYARILSEAADALAFVDPNMHGLRVTLIRALSAADGGEDPAETLADISESCVPAFVADGDLDTAIAIEGFAARCFQMRNHRMAHPLFQGIATDETL
jgi:hypothetical protein